MVENRELNTTQNKFEEYVESTKFKRSKRRGAIIQIIKKGLLTTLNVEMKLKLFEN